MTICVAVKCSDGYVFGCDGRVLSGHIIDPNRLPKMFKVGNPKHPMWVMAAGNVRTVQKVMGKNPQKVQDILDAYDELDKDDDEQMSFIVRSRGKVYHIDADGSIGEVTNYALAGSGSLTGAALAKKEFDFRRVKDRLTTKVDSLVWEVMGAVSDVDVTCGPPFTSKIFKTRAPKDG